MSTFELPELRADSVVGFLAALGTLRTVVVEFGDPTATLCWPNGPYAPAELTTDLFHGTADLAGRLFEQVEVTRSNGQLIPGVNDFPIRSPKGTTVDPMRGLPMSTIRPLAEQAWRDPRLADWLSALVGVSAPNEAGNVALTPLIDAGPGPVFVERTLRDLLVLLTSPQTIEDAFNAWSRADSMGAYLDSRADIDRSRWQATTDVVKYGEPAATWLALQALPFFPVRATPTARPVAWRLASRADRPKFHYPVWRRQLRCKGIAALLDHPSVDLHARTKGNLTRSQAEHLRALGVTALFESTRDLAGKGNGAMRVPVEIWRG